MKPGQTSFNLGTEELNLPQENSVDGDLSILSNSGHGAYRRLKSHAGYRKAEGIAGTSGGSSILMKDGNTAYLYLGASTTSNGQIDFGLIYSPARNSWLPFNLYNGIMTVYTNENSTSPWGWHGIPAGTNVFLRFYVSANNQVSLDVETPDGKKHTFIKDTLAGHKFMQNGQGVMMKRLTTIGQTPESLNNGSYFKDSRWTNVRIATSTTMGFWTSNHTSERFFYPDDTKQVIIRTTNFDYNEAVDIILN